MGIFSHDGLASSVIADLARMSEAAYAGGSPPVGWRNLQGSELGGVFSGDTYISGRARAEVFVSGNSLTLAFQGTDHLYDVFDYFGLVTNNYLDKYTALFNALQTYVLEHSITTVYVTGHSLGGGAANSLREESATRGGGIFDDASFVTFASPIMSSDSDILNIGHENDWVHEYIDRLVPFGPRDFASSTDHIIWYNDTAWLNDDLNIDPRSFAEFFSGITGLNANYPHRMVNYIESVDRIIASEFYSLMNRDSIVIIAATDLPISAFGTGSTNIIGPAFYLGQDSADILNGTRYGDYIEGNDGNDILAGFAGADNIRGGGGVDEVWGGAGNDTIDGGAGRDVIFYLDASAGVTVNLSQSGVNVSGGLGNDRLTNIEDVIGTAGNDTLIGNGDDNLLVGLGGDDTIIGNGGHDTLMGTGSFNIMDGGSGNDVLEAGSATGINTGGSGADTFIFHSLGQNHTITDYQDEVDFIMINTVLAGHFEDLNIWQSGNTAMVQIGLLTLALENTDIAVLETTDILLV
ncbi:hypothetical protein [Profundibacter sp.]